MNTSEFDDAWNTATDMDTSPNHPVKVIDADGFVHDIVTVVFDLEDQCFYIRTKWSYE